MRKWVAAWRLSRSGTLAGHSALYGTAGVLGKVAALVTVPYLTRELGPGGYGLTDLATSLAALLTLLVRFAGDMPVMRLSAAAPGLPQRRTLFSSYVFGTAGVSILVSALLVPASGALASVLWSSPGSSALAVAALALVPVSATQAALINVLRAQDRPGAASLLAVVDLFAQLALAVTLVALGYGPMGVMLGFIGGSLIGLLAAGVVARSVLTTNIELPLAWRILREGLPFLPGVAAFVLADTVARMLAANLLSVAAVGQLAFAIRLASVMALASSAFSMAWGPYGLSLRPSAATSKIFRAVLTVQMILIATVAIALGALAPELATLVAGPEFTDASTVIPGLLISAGLAGPLYVLSTAAGIAYADRWVAYSSVIGSASQITAAAVLLVPLGIAGFALASIIGRLVSLLMLSLKVSQTARITRGAYAVLGGATAIAIAIQMLNAAEAKDTLPVRAAITGAALLVGTMAIGARLTRSSSDAVASSFGEKT